MTILDKKSRFTGGLAAILTLMVVGQPTKAAPKATQSVNPLVPMSDPRFRVGELLYSDNFEHGISQWSSELENGGRVEPQKGLLEVDVPQGATVWWKHELEGPLLIEYEAQAVDNKGTNDRVSDLNCFWMARDVRSLQDLLAYKRSGKFSDYNQLKTYYVGLGGNGNTTTRFRRYIGDAEKRPLLPEHDLHDKKDLLVPNQWQTIQLVASGPLVQFYRDGKRIFEFTDEAPYTSGWFGLRTTSSHLLFRHFRIFRLEPTESKAVPATTYPVPQTP